MSLRPALPIDPLLPQIAAALRDSKSLIVQASPGSGKTTRIPPYLLEAGIVDSNLDILVLVPRRLAAKMSARRVAEEMGEEVGGRVGYQFRFEKAMGASTRLKFLTEGMLFRYLVEDPSLARAGLVILDEFHERHLHSDLALSYLKRLQSSSRPDLRILVMSATLEVEGLSQFLPGSTVFQLEAPRYPVSVEYLPSDPKKNLEIRVAEAFRYAQTQAPAEIRRGDALVFLPGMAEIRRCTEALEGFLAGQYEILPLHGDLPREAQAKVFEKGKRPKVVLATNIAETSLTLEGVTLVVDSGLQRQASYSWWSGIPALKTRPTSKAAGIQRTGRAGRTGPGLCYRLFSTSDWEARLAFETPEIRRSDLTQSLLELKAMGASKLDEFPWFEAPPPGALQASAMLLFQLGATATADVNAVLTELGRRMSKIPIHPRLARFLCEAEDRRCLAPAIRLAALIAEDALEAGDALSQVEFARVSDAVRRLESQLAGYFLKGTPRSAVKEEDLAYALLTGFPDRVAKRRDLSLSTEKQRRSERSAEVELVFCNGGAGLLRAEHALEGEFFLVLDVQEKQALAQSKPVVHVRALAPLQPEWLFDWQGSLLLEEKELNWDEKLGRVSQVSRIRYGQLVLSESSEAPEDAPAAERLFLKRSLGLALEDPEAQVLTMSQVLSKLGHSPEIEEAFAKIGWLKKVFPDEELPNLEGRELAKFLQKIFEGIDSRRAFEAMDVSGRCQEALPAAMSAWLSRELPSHLNLAGGRRVKVHYPWGREPWIESRMQDFFGASQSPRLAGGKVPLLLHLLAPNQRAVQVTQDLAGFWKNTYPQVRQQLMRRYPRHRWPENPESAPSQPASPRGRTPR